MCYGWSYLHITWQASSRDLPSSITEKVGHKKLHIQFRVSDEVLNNGSAVLNDGLLLLEFKDSIKEGDGPRILHYWKAFLLYFKFASHHNYAKQAFRTLASVNALAIPRTAAQMMWSWVVNTSRPQYTTWFTQWTFKPILFQVLVQTLPNQPLFNVEKVWMEWWMFVKPLMNSMIFMWSHHQAFLIKRWTLDHWRTRYFNIFQVMSIVHFVESNLDLGKLSEWIKEQKTLLQFETKFYNHTI